MLGMLGRNDIIAGFIQFSKGLMMRVLNFVIENGDVRDEGCSVGETVIPVTNVMSANFNEIY